MRLLLCGVAALAWSISWGAHADEWRLNPTIDPPTDGSKLDSSKMYVLEVTCTRTKIPLPRPTQRSFWRMLAPYRDRTLAHFIYLSGDRIPAPVSITQSADSKNMLWVAYSVDTAKKTLWDGITSACPYKPSLLTERDEEWAFVGAGSSTTLDAGTIVGIVQNVAKAGVNVGAAAGHYATDQTGKQLTGFQNVTDPITALVSAIEPDHLDNVTKAIRLGETTTTIKTRFSEINITIRAPTSLAADSNLNSANGLPYLLTDLRSHKLVAMPATVDASNTSCTTLANELNQAGFGDQDIAYGVAFVAGRTVAKDKLAACLGDSGVKASLTLSPRVWKSLTPYNRAILDTDIVKTESDYLKAVMPLLAKYAQSKSDNDEILAQIASNISTDVTLGGKADRLGADMPTSKLDKILDDLAKKGFVRFGFFAPTTADMQKNYGGAPYGFLMIHADAKAESAPLSQTVVAYPVFDANGLVTNIFVSQSSDEAKVFAGSRAPGKNFTIDLDH